MPEREREARRLATIHWAARVLGRLEERWGKLSDGARLSTVRACARSLERAGEPPRAGPMARYVVAVSGARREVYAEDPELAARFALLAADCDGLVSGPEVPVRVEAGSGAVHHFAAEMSRPLECRLRACLRAPGQEGLDAT